MKPWIEAMRLRTLPVSVAGVVGGTACALAAHGFYWLPMVICLLFAVIAQIASNFANEYYDYKNGLDRKGREGFRRGVTEGDISPRAMLRATYALLIVDSLLGCSLIYFGGWWLIAVGVAVAIFAVAYSAGPYPLSHHGLGDIAVVIFFGLVPVIFTDYVQALPATGEFHLNNMNICSALAIGLLAANVLIVNNYRDADDDRAVGKRTTAVIFGCKTMSRVYLANGFAAMCLFVFATITAPLWTFAVWLVLANRQYLLYAELRQSEGTQLNLTLKHTAMFLLLCSAMLLGITVCCYA